MRNENKCPSCGADLGSIKLSVSVPLSLYEQARKKVNSVSPSVVMQRALQLLIESE